MINIVIIMTQSAHVCSKTILFYSRGLKLFLFKVSVRGLRKKGNKGRKGRQQEVVILEKVQEIVVFMEFVDLR